MLTPMTWTHWQSTGASEMTQPSDICRARRAADRRGHRQRRRTAVAARAALGGGGQATRHRRT